MYRIYCNSSTICFLASGMANYFVGLEYKITTSNKGYYNLSYNYKDNSPNDFIIGFCIGGNIKFDELK